VFLAGGFTRGGQNPYYRFHGDDGYVVHDLAMDPANEPSNAAEETDEHRRLFYVALMRAMYKLYVPRFGAAKGKPGPVVTLLNAALTAARPEERCPGACRCVSFDGTATTDVSGAKPWKAKLDRPPKGMTPSPTVEPPGAAPRPLFPSGDPAFRDAGARLMSFTSLAAGAAAGVPADTPDERAFGERDARPGDEEAEAPLTSPAATVNVLPYGNVSGDLLHQVLEGVNFAVVAEAHQPARLLDDPSTRLLLDRLIRDHYPIIAAGDAAGCDACRTEIAEMVWRTLRTPLPAAGGPLCEITAADRLHELQFYYPLEGLGAAAVRALGVEAVSVCRGDYVLGVIDLVFRRGERYFLADFKSNMIDDGYGPDTIRANMAHHRYDLQYQLYTLALVRWLRQVYGDGFDVERQFGGVYCLYMRGMDGGGGGDDGPGVFHHRPTAEEVRGYEQRMARMVGKAGDP
jgi:exodeoxyribonuclease V beta subunit